MADTITRERQPLTIREKQYMGLVCQGLPNSEIAQSLSVKVPTVRATLFHVYKKLGARNRAHAAVLYVSSRKGEDGHES